MSDPSQTQILSSSGDEINIRELFMELWRGKFIIVICVIAAITLAAFGLRSAERKYTVSYVFTPVASNKTSPNLGGFSGLASLAGVSLPSSSSNDFLTFKFLLKSEEVASQLIEDQYLTRSIFESEWDSDNEIFRQPPDGRYTSYIRTVKKLLTGQDALAYVAPNAARLSNWLNSAFSSSEDRETGFLTLSAETPKPLLLIDVMARVTQATDRLLKERYVESAEQTMGFYQQQLAKARAREHREALAKLIAQEDQKLMLASRGTYFVAAPLTEPSVSLTPTSPKAPLVLLLSVVLGGSFGAAFVFIRKALKA